MTDAALEAFCFSYMSCINETSKKIGLTVKNFEPGQLYKDILKNEDILKLAINPQLTSVIASIYNQCDGVLPDKRIDLYEKAIEKMIERLVEMIASEQTKPNSIKSFSLNKVVILTIMQEIAEYLHARSEGLSEEILKSLIKNSLVQYEKIVGKKCDDFEGLTLTIVNLLKIHSGLLTEFGHNSFKFLHRTFQEYLVAMNMIYFHGNQRDEITILKNISMKI
jgi:predicted NACHT family NTPase